MNKIHRVCAEIHKETKIEGAGVMNGFKTIKWLVLMITAVCLTAQDGVQTQATPPGASPQKVTFQLDSSRSHFEVLTSSSGLFRAFGHDHIIAVKDFSGTVELDPSALDRSALHMRVKASSLALSGAKVSEKDRKEIEGTMRNQVLEVDRFPEIIFKSTHVATRKISEGEYDAKIEGDLELHGVTRHEVIPAHLKIGEHELSAKGEFLLKQSEFGIKPVTAGGGTVKVKNEVKFSFNIIGARHP
jgi:polyisoprenoid-binding protein YceI